MQHPFQPAKSEAASAWPRRRCGSAFTLIEMLVVISIISILAGMLLPALSRARQEGRNVKYINALHNIGLAMTDYSSNYGEYRALDYAPTTGSNGIYLHEAPFWDGPVGLGMLRQDLAREIYFPGEHTHVKMVDPLKYRCFEGWGKRHASLEVPPENLECQWFYFKAGYGRPAKHTNADEVAMVIPYQGVSADDRTLFYPEDGTTTWILADSGRVKALMNSDDIGLRQFNVLDPAKAAEYADQALKR